MNAIDAADLVLQRVEAFLERPPDGPGDDRLALKEVIVKAITDARVAPRIHGPVVQIGDRIRVLGVHVQVMDIALLADQSKQLVTKQP